MYKYKDDKMRRIKMLLVAVVAVVVFVVIIASILFPRQSSNTKRTYDAIKTQTESNVVLESPQKNTKIKSSTIQKNPKIAVSTTSNSNVGDKADTPISSEDLESLIEPGFYAEPWKRKLEEYDNLIDVPIRKIAEPKDYSIKYNPTPNRSYRNVLIVTTWMNSLQEPVSRLARNGSVSIKRDFEGFILVEQELEPPWALITGAEMPELSFQSPLRRQFLVRDGALHLIQQTSNGREVEDTPFVDGNNEEFILDLPKGITPQVGTPWEISREKPFPSKAIHTLVGFAEVNGVRTAKIYSQTELPIKQSKVTYVELGTGIVVRTESEFVQETPGVKVKIIAISQTIPVNE